MIPFVLNDSTKYISPTKTPEYLAGGKPVISTSIIDVVTPYGVNSLVHIADTAEEFIKAARKSNEIKNAKWLKGVDAFLADNSWDKTWGRMFQLIETTFKHKQSKKTSTEINSLRANTNIVTI